MGLTEILIIINLVAVLGVGIWLFMATKAKQASGENQEMLRVVQDLKQEVLRLQNELKNTNQAMRTEMQNENQRNRTELSSTLHDSSDRLSRDLRTAQRETFEGQRRELQELFAAREKQIREMMTAQDQKLTQLLEMQDKMLTAMQTALLQLMTEKMDGIGTTMSQRLAELERQFQAMREQNRIDGENLRRLVAEKLDTIQSNNQQQLEKMRATVDEKLQDTLNERISQSFKMVNERLAEVQQGLGEMRTLATNVGDLKKVMSGVKTRGILGEIQLGAIIEELMAPEQYDTNIATIPGSSNRVEYAIRLPGEGAGFVYLPIDAKFPADAYQHLQDAYDTADPEQVKVAKATLEQRIKLFAKDIQTKYIAPPYTTNFGIMFLPTEGLYAEVVRMGLVEFLQKQFGISIAGPTTLAALLNSLQMGFRTLAIQKRSGEVWQTLSAVKSEFGKFQIVLKAAQKRIEQTGEELEKLVGVRTRQIDRKLRSVAELPTEDAVALLEDETGDE